jgi:hypothetical protein
MKRRKFSASALLVAGYLFVAAPFWSNAGHLGEIERAPYPSVLPYYEPMTGHERRAQLENVQEALKEKGYYEGPIDGTLDVETQPAIRSFQRANNLEATGLLEAREATGTDSAIELWEEQRFRD